MTATLTERYIAATVRGLPPGLQSEVRDELQTSIADAIDARAENGEPVALAEREVLTELGDPGILAAGYADRPLHLIGPRYFLTWWRLLKVLLAIVPACAVGGVVIAQALTGAAIGQIIGEAVVVALSVIVHVSFWTTLVFVILERTGADTGVGWSVDQLPNPPESADSRTGRADLVVSLVLLALFAGALLWDRFIGFAYVGGELRHVLDPALWPWGIGAVLVVIAGEAALAIAVYARGTWSAALAAVNTVLAIAFLSMALTALGTGALFDDRVVDAVFAHGGDAATPVLGALAGVLIAGISIWDAVDGWRKVRLHRRAA
ncbi:hypothetical protein [Microbacterium sp. USHLN186]|uniref:hypothetical protein n=1 Tax=Microbacterium sp. USHLN186 TaxID=3081286 RepID=UPI003018CF0E